MPERTRNGATALKSRIWFTLWILVVCRLGTYIPIPGINPDIVEQVLRPHDFSMLYIFDVFAGGAFGRMAIFGLGLMPYISAAVIMQLMTAVSPTLEQRKKEGETGRKKINQYTRYGTVLLATVQGYGISVGLEGFAGSQGAAVIDPGLVFRLTTVATLTGAAVFLVWLAGQISERGVGNGFWLIIFAGVAAELSKAGFNTLAL